MKQVLSLIGVIASLALFAQNPNYDSTLAKKVGADDYGMKQYVFAILKTGDNKTTNKAFVDSCFAGHFSNMNKMAEEGQLFVAGPFGENDKEMRGLFILNVTTLEEAKALVKNDPAIDSGILKAELYPWYGSAALGEYLPAADKVWKKQP